MLSHVLNAKRLSFALPALTPSVSEQLPGEGFRGSGHSHRTSEPPEKGEQDNRDSKRHGTCGPERIQDTSAYALSEDRWGQGFLLSLEQ